MLLLRPSIVLCFFLIILFNYSSFAQQSAIGKLERRIVDLEKRVENLETQVSELRSQVRLLTSRTEQSSSYNQPAKQPAKEKQNWRRLYVGMSMSEVRNIFGEPDKVSQGPSLTFWYYKTDSYLSGEIDFDQNGRVTSWSEP